MKDIVVLIPGIMGSELQNQNKENVWSFPSGTLSRELRNIISKVVSRKPLEHLLLQELILEGDNDPERPILNDGIEATGLIQDHFKVPGFSQLYHGYSDIRKKLTSHPFNLELEKNYFEFPYDWRRDIRSAAYRLKDFINERLPNDSDTKVIFIAHSMGGLVARYYLEYLDGANKCKALITLGTPFHGSPKILNYLVNGYSVRDVFGNAVSVLVNGMARITRSQSDPSDLTEVLHSFTSTYQLLPKYKVVLNQQGIGELRVEDLDPKFGLDGTRARAAQEFLNLPKKSQGEYPTFPGVGIGQKTLQSATVVDGQLLMSSEQVPPNEDGECFTADGDDTVPRFSAVPIELIGKSQEKYFGQAHGGLQSSEKVWDWLNELINQTIQNPKKAPQDIGGINQGKEPPTIRLSVQDLYLCTEGEQVRLQAEFVGVESNTLQESENFGGLHAIIKPARESEQQEIQAQFAPDSHLLTLEPNQLTPGLYQLEVITGDYHPQFTDEAPEPVKTLFHII